jgi:hypothetical protein
MSQPTTLMPRPSIKKYYTCIEIKLDTDDKKAFQKWCQVNNLTMADVVRREIQPFINQGYSMQ